MQLSIDHYSTWAQQNLSSEVALGKDGLSLDKASKQVGVFARFFGTKSAQSVRTNVMADFTRALSYRFGATLAQQALSEAGLTPTSKLDGKTIKAVIKFATDIRTAEVDSLMDTDIRLFNRSITIADVRGDNGYGEDRMKKYLAVRSLAIDAIGEMPHDQASYDQFCERCERIIARLHPITQSVIPPRTPAERAVQHDALALTRALCDRMDEMKAMLEDLPRSDKNMEHFKEVWADGLAKALEKLMPNSSPALQNAIRTVVQGYGENIDDFYASMPYEKDMHKMLAKKFIADLKQHVPAKEISFKEDFLANQIFSGYRQALNEGDWAPISKTATATVGDMPVALKSDIVPGAYIGASSVSGGKGPIGRTYEQGVNGYMCHCADTRHAVNLAVSSITVDGADQPAFQGIRHGVHCAWEIKDEGERRTANVQRAQEAVIAAFLANPGYIENGETSLTMTSVSLLTPDSARHTFSKGGPSDERQMLLEQKAAWDTVSREGVQFQYNGQTITIRPKVITFNFGVNSGAVNYSSIAPNLAGGWDLSDELNRQARGSMETAVNDFLRDTAEDMSAEAMKKRKAVLELFQQCKDILDGHAERTDGNDAYKAAARLAVLTYLIGGTPCWNCKSGKDRTGQLDVECKFLATLIARGESIPKPGADLTTEQSALLRTIAIEGGNFEMQSYNTGAKGFKTNGVGSIGRRLGGQQFREIHGGASEFVKV